MMYQLERELLIPAPRDQVFAFFENPRNLAKVTPKWINFEDFTREGPPMRVGMRTKHHIKWLGIAIRWTSRIVEYDPPSLFVDAQTGGPYRFWRHEHEFESVDGGTLMRDRVRYELPFGILGHVTHRLIIERQLRGIFDYRARRIKKMFPAAADSQPAESAPTTQAPPE